jgi:predicted SAM-dependent methyltransferase
MLKIHIGCGKRDFGSKWLHVDGARWAHVESNDIWLSCIDARSVDVIYVSHMIAYFDKEQAATLMHTWFMKLKPGGILRIATPDMETMSMLYLIHKHPLDSFLGPIYGRMQMNNEFIYHKTTYDFKSLCDILLKIGFKDVQKYNWRNTEHAHIDDHSQAYIPHMDKEKGTLISLNIEAIK